MNLSSIHYPQCDVMPTGTEHMMKAWCGDVCWFMITTGTAVNCMIVVWCGMSLVSSTT